jgi:hypothetical protein
MPAMRLLGFQIVWLAAAWMAHADTLEISRLLILRHPPTADRTPFLCDSAIPRDCFELYSRFLDKRDRTEKRLRFRTLRDQP